MTEYQQDVWEGLKLIKTCAALDIGQLRDASVLTILETYERLQEDPFGEKPNRFKTLNREYHIAYQEQKKGLDYPSQKEWILSKLDAYTKFPNKKRVPLTLLCELNGVGLTVFQMLKKELPTCWNSYGCILTAGNTIEKVDLNYHIPKPEIINSLVYVLDNGTLKIPHDLPTKNDLLNQCSGFIREFTETGKEKLGSDTQARHDDIVISTAYAVWYSLFRREAGACPGLYGSVAQATDQYHVEPASELDKLVESFNAEWKKRRK